MLIALCCVLYAFSIELPLLGTTQKITFAYLAAALIGLVGGPAVAIPAALIIDTLSFLLHPTGPYIPWFCLVWVLQMLLWSAFLYRRPLGAGRLFLAKLAHREKDVNFIGIDIKGARMWRGAKTATDRRMHNVGFLRTRIEFIDALFAENEVSEIWITFPDPQLKTRRAKKRLTSPLYLACYARLLRPDGWINLKTDSKHLYAYTGEVIRHYGLTCEVSEPDIYGSGFADEVLSVKTAYETRFLEMGLPITYTRFALDGRHEFPWFDWEEDDKEEKDNEAERQLR